MQFTVDQWWSGRKLADVDAVHAFTLTEWLKIAAAIAFEFAPRVASVTRTVLDFMTRDQPNSRFHGRDIFREIGRLP